MKTRDGAARNRNETKGKELACNNGPGTIDELCEAWHFQVRQDQKDAESQRENGAELHEGAQVIAWRKE